MFKSPLVIEVEDVFGLIKLKPMAKWDEQLQREAFKLATQTMLEQFEANVRQKEIIEKEENESPASFTEKLIAQILDNLKISIKNIYFRFEDTMSGIVSGNREFTIGVRMKEFSVFTVDENFKRKEYDEV